MTSPKICITCGIEKPFEEFTLKKKAKTGRSNRCKLCSKLYLKDYHLKNKERHYELNRLWLKNHPTHKKEMYLKHYSKVIRRVLERRLVKDQANPSWANPDKIKEIYLERDRLTRETGIEHHVDHIIPLKGKLVSGLHVENNLRVIPAKENLMKQAKFIEELL